MIRNNNEPKCEAHLIFNISGFLNKWGYEQTNGVVDELGLAASSGRESRIHGLIAGKPSLRVKMPWGFQVLSYSGV